MPCPSPSTRAAATAGAGRVSVPRYFVGLDLGQARDPTAVAVVRRVDEPAPEDLVAMLVARATNRPTRWVPSNGRQRQQERLRSSS
jgi:hypothetical protein